jgi:hypothetical protein
LPETDVQDKLKAVAKTSQMTLFLNPDSGIE